MIIRQVELKDVEYCAAIEEACFEPSEAASLEKIKVRAELFPHGFIVGELDGKIVGMINSGATAKSDITDEALKAMSSHDPEGRNLVIFSIAVAPDHQGKGHSRSLVEAFFERAKAQGRKQILLICKDHLVNYYEHFEFQYGGKSKSTHGGFEWHEMIYTI